MARKERIFTIECNGADGAFDGCYCRVQWICVLKPHVFIKMPAVRYDPASGAIVIMLGSFEMYGTAKAVSDLIEQGARAFDARVPIVYQLLKAELAECEVRSIACHRHAGHFPAYKDLSNFGFAASDSFTAAGSLMVHKTSY
jgi:hypothetical protein